LGDIQQEAYSPRRRRRSAYRLPLHIEADPLITAKMFFLKEETKIISLHPSYFGPNMRDYLVDRLNEEEEGRCTGDHFVICVMDMVEIGEGRVIPSNGNAEYTIKYRAIIWKPFRGETVCADDRALGSGS